MGKVHMAQCCYSGNLQDEKAIAKLCQLLETGGVSISDTAPAITSKRETH